MHSTAIAPRTELVFRHALVVRITHWVNALCLLVVTRLAYLINTIASGHARRDLAPTRGELEHIGTSISEHIRFHLPKGEEAKRYNVLQKLAYLAVIFGLLPLAILSGLTMSPA